MRFQTLKAFRAPRPPLHRLNPVPTANNLPFILIFLHAPPPPPPPASSSSPASILINVLSLPSSFSHLHRSLATFVVRSIVNVVLRQICIIHLIILSPRLTSLHPTNVRLTRLPLAKDPLDSILRFKLGLSSTPDTGNQSQCGSFPSIVTGRTTSHCDSSEGERLRCLEMPWEGRHLVARCIRDGT